MGGGVGGTASAYFLRQLLRGDSTPEIDIFEVDKVGGRLRVAELGGHEYEAGGAVIHPRNTHMQQFVKQLGKRTTIRGVSEGEVLTPFL